MVLVTSLDIVNLYQESVQNILETSNKEQGHISLMICIYSYVIL